MHARWFCARPATVKISDYRRCGDCWPIYSHASIWLVPQRFFTVVVIVVVGVRVTHKYIFGQLGEERSGAVVRSPRTLATGEAQIWGCKKPLQQQFWIIIVVKCWPQLCWHCASVGRVIWAMLFPAAPWPFVFVVVAAAAAGNSLSENRKEAHRPRC